MTVRSMTTGKELDVNDFMVEVYRVHSGVLYYYVRGLQLSDGTNVILESYVNLDDALDRCDQLKQQQKELDESEFDLPFA